MPPTPSTLQRAELQRIWTDEETLATTMLVLFVDVYGTEGFEWSPETIALEIEEDFRVQLPQPNFDRLMTAINLLTSDDFYKSLPDFIHHCNVLSGDTYDPRHWDPADAGEVAWGITEALLLAPPEENDEEPFTEEILSYIGRVLDEEGIIKPPDVLRLALRDNTPEGKVHGEFSDDPEMFAAIQEFETTKTEAINQGIKGNLQLLAQQLDALPLRSGSTRDVVQNMLHGFGSALNQTASRSVLV